MEWRIRKKSREAKTVVGRNELRGDAVQSGQGGFLFVRGQRKFNHEQENPRVRGEVGIANPFGSIISSHDPRHPAVPTLVDRSTNRHHHKAPRGLPLRLFSTHYNPRRASSSLMESRHRRALLVANLVHHGNSLSVYSSPQPRFALINCIFLMPAIPLPEYRR
jgi:hypothetical protein